MQFYKYTVTPTATIKICTSYFYFFSILHSIFSSFAVHYSMFIYCVFLMPYTPRKNSTNTTDIFRFSFLRQFNKEVKTPVGKRLFETSLKWPRLRSLFKTIRNRYLGIYSLSLQSLFTPETTGRDNEHWMFGVRNL